VQLPPTLASSAARSREMQARAVDGEVEVLARIGPQIQPQRPAAPREMGWTARRVAQHARVRAAATAKEAPTMSIAMIGLDTAKSVFQLHAVDAAGKVVAKRKLRRTELAAFFTAQAPCTVVMEACGGAQHWARVLAGLGHDVRLLAPEAVRPFVRAGRKNDAADAAALCEAASRPDARFVRPKTAEQQAALALHAARSLLVKQQTMLGNAMRGLAAEFGLTAPQGRRKLGEILALLEADAEVPERARRAIGVLHERCRALGDGIEALEAEIVAHARRDEKARRLATIPGVGPITASLIAATVADAGAFRSARHFAAWLGLVPRQYSTGGKTRLGRITKAGDREVRRSLVLGATSMIHRAARWDSSAGAWTRALLERRPARLATVALANKMARVAWALMTRNQVYQARGRVAAVADATA
jgi:transposase